MLHCNMRQSCGLWVMWATPTKSHARQAWVMWATRPHVLVWVMWATPTRVQINPVSCKPSAWGFCVGDCVGGLGVVAWVMRLRRGGSCGLRPRGTPPIR